MRKILTVAALAGALLISTASRTAAHDYDEGRATNRVSPECLTNAQNAFLLAFQGWSTTNLTNGVEVGLQSGLDAFYDVIRPCVCTNATYTYTNGTSNGTNEGSYQLTNGPIQEIICQNLAEVAFWRSYISSTNGVWESRVEDALNAYVRELQRCLCGRDNDRDDDGGGRPRGNHPGNNHPGNHPGNHHPGNKPPGNNNPAFPGRSGPGRGN